MTDKARGELVPGGLAMVYGLRRDIENNGKVVELVRFMRANEMLTSPITGSPCRSVNPGWLAIGNIINSSRNEENGCDVFKPENLLPIHPEADPLDIAETMEQRA